MKRDRQMIVPFGLPLGSDRHSVSKGVRTERGRAYRYCFSNVKTFKFRSEFFPMFFRRVAQQGINQHHAVFGISGQLRLYHGTAAIGIHLFRAITLSALPNLRTTVSSKVASRLICAKTVLKPYRYTPRLAMSPLGEGGIFLAEEPTAGPGWKRGSASTRRLRIAVAGRQTLSKDFCEERIWTT
jgi:hypothetical protein